MIQQTTSAAGYCPFYHQVPETLSCGLNGLTFLTSGFRRNFGSFPERTSTTDCATVSAISLLLPKVEVPK